MAESRERFLEGMDITLKAWCQERLAYEGQFYRLPEVMVVPHPHPPIAIAATHSPASVEAAVAHR